MINKHKTLDFNPWDIYKMTSRSGLQKKVAESIREQASEQPSYTAPVLSSGPFLNGRL